MLATSSYLLNQPYQERCNEQKVHEKHEFLAYENVASYSYLSYVISVNFWCTFLVNHPT